MPGQIQDGQKKGLRRLTKERGLTASSGIGYAVSLVKRKGAGVLVTHAALPCAWGSSMQNLHKKRLGTGEKYQAYMDELYAQFVALIRNFHKLAGQVTCRHGGIIFEWPTNNKSRQRRTWPADMVLSRWDSTDAD